MKHALDDGTEIDLDISEHIENELKSYKRKLKVGHEEREVSIDELAERYPLAEGAHSRFREAAKMEKEAGALKAQVDKLGSILRDPAQAPAVLRKLLGEEGFRSMAESAIAEEVRRATMTPAQRAEADRRDQMSEADRQREEGFKSREQKIASEEARIAKARTDEYAKTFQRDFPIVLKQHGVPVTPRSMAMMAEAKKDALRLKIPYSDADLAKQVGEELRSLASHYNQSLEPEQLREHLGPAADKLREADVERLASQPGRRATPVKAKPSIPNTIKTHTQLRAHLAAQDKAKQSRWRPGQ